jgi:hypothetical protein
MCGFDDRSDIGLTQENAHDDDIFFVQGVQGMGRGMAGIIRLVMKRRVGDNDDGFFGVAAPAGVGRLDRGIINV